MMSTMVVAMVKVVMAVHLEAMVHLRTPMVVVMVDLLGAQEKTHMLDRGTPCMGLMDGWHTEHQTLARHTTTTTT